MHLKQSCIGVMSIRLVLEPVMTKVRCADIVSITIVNILSMLKLLGYLIPMGCGCK